ncbi:hypothetical protein KCV06_g130, partial [Aureobasidium melanogenum]
MVSLGTLSCTSDLVTNHGGLEGEYRKGEEETFCYVNAINFSRVLGKVAGLLCVVLLQPVFAQYNRATSVEVQNGKPTAGWSEGPKATSTSIEVISPLPTIYYNCYYAGSLCNNVELTQTGAHAGTIDMELVYDKDAKRKKKRRYEICPSKWNKNHVCPEVDQPDVWTIDPSRNPRSSSGETVKTPKKLSTSLQNVAAKAGNKALKYLIADYQNGVTGTLEPSGLMYTCDEFPFARLVDPISEAFERFQRRIDVQCCNILCSSEFEISKWLKDQGIAYPSSDQNEQSKALSALAKHFAKLNGDLFLFKLKTINDPDDPRFAYMDTGEEEDENDDVDANTKRDLTMSSRFTMLEILVLASVLDSRTMDSSQLPGLVPSVRSLPAAALNQDRLQRTGLTLYRQAFHLQVSVLVLSQNGSGTFTDAPKPVTPPESGPLTTIASQSNSSIVSDLTTTLYPATSSHVSSQFINPNSSAFLAINSTWSTISDRSMPVSAVPSVSSGTLPTLNSSGTTIVTTGISNQTTVRTQKPVSGNVTAPSTSSTTVVETSAPFPANQSVGLQESSTLLSTSSDVTSIALPASRSSLSSVVVPTLANATSSKWSTVAILANSTSTAASSPTTMANITLPATNATTGSEISFSSIETSASSNVTGSGLTSISMSSNTSISTTIVNTSGGASSTFSNADPDVSITLASLTGPALMSSTSQAPSSLLPGPSTTIDSTLHHCLTSVQVDRRNNHHTESDYNQGPDHNISAHHHRYGILLASHNPEPW